MALSDGNLWLSLSRLGAQAKRSDAGYPPYNVEVPPGNERGPELLRITLAVAGFGRDDLEVRVENGELAIRGVRREEGPKDFCTTASPRNGSNGPSPLPGAWKSGRPSCSMACWPSSWNGLRGRNASSRLGSRQQAELLASRQAGGRGSAMRNLNVHE